MLRTESCVHRDPVTPFIQPLLQQRANPLTPGVWHSTFTAAAVSWPGRRWKMKISEKRRQTGESGFSDPSLYCASLPSPRFYCESDRGADLQEWCGLGEDTQAAAHTDPDSVICFSLRLSRKRLLNENDYAAALIVKGEWTEEGGVVISINVNVNWALESSNWVFILCTFFLLAVFNTINYQAACVSLQHQWNL